MREIKCSECNQPMKCLGNVSGFVYASYPEQWDEVYVCDECKTKTTVREHGQIYDPTGGRNLDEFKTIFN